MTGAAAQPLDTFLASYAPTAGHKCITLTFAQSTDGKIAGAQRQRVQISGEASMEMTHRLRALHDAILVGIGTVLHDDPQLNVRLGSATNKHPRPVVLDNELQTPLSSQLIRNATNGSGRVPLILAARPHHAADVADWHRRREMLTHAGAEVALVESETDDKLTWPAIRATLHDHHLFSVMVEGGATVIDSLLAANAEQPGMVQSVIVTVGAKPIGADGVSYTTPLPLDGGEKSGLKFAEALELAPDRIVALRS
ncbi:hypothetical protein GLX27_003247 [Malassezia furfur]|uniref:2,5-diamino-6-ribosylamino-4(3H)-pyrimidinone 5'-phosphate reductase n=1 Tax=Malassezia furfur TaxID=55194 RepID=A0ABY8ESM2_MALFU|nr:hypothetical protein CBS14141_002883 [Malassezia furfur]WFD48577.1 hypothetical protein GLX27_003247 [Malassezia furfur]